MNKIVLNKNKQQQQQKTLIALALTDYYVFCRQSTEIQQKKTNTTNKHMNTIIITASVSMKKVHLQV